ncbi:Cro/CI family transcriptional regulator [Neorhizobium sp. Rsf11]|uniref:Cro/CI family transcriptional regulator n=1 Tax=Neorhizobium phenanthreniclasticum TaxID=3157917 RepID=A0ABV0LW99_9HYPH
MTTNTLALDEAISAVGSASELARRLGITPAAVLQWDQVPPTRVLAVEEISGVSRHRLRPDIYGPERQAAE